MKAVMISIQPKWCEPIANGKKTIEVRKTKPKLETPFKCYIYCTQGNEMLWILREKERNPHQPKISDMFIADAVGGATKANGKVIGEFVCDGSEILFNTNGNPPNYIAEILPDILKRAAMTFEEFQIYVNGRAAKNSIYGWHISDLVIYDKPKELSEFKKHNRHCHYEHLGLATPKCSECKGCQLERPPQSWCYVEEQT